MVRTVLVKIKILIKNKTKYKMNNKRKKNVINKLLKLLYLFIYFYLFLYMDNTFTEEHERFLNSLSDIPPSPFCVGNIVVRQPSEQEIYKKQIKPWEKSVLLRYGPVNEYAYQKQYGEVNNLGDIRFKK